MSRILVPLEECWYEEIALFASYSEGDYVRLLRQHMSHVFQDFITVSYSADIANQSGVTKRADLAMIKKDYTEWWVVEVEKGEHDLKHVLDQVNVFLEGKYNHRTTSKLLIKNYKAEYPDSPSLDENKLQDLIFQQQPKVFVIVDQYSEKWYQELDKLDIKLCIFEIYKNTNGMNVFRLFGGYPEVRICESHCQYDTKKNNTLLVVTPDELKIDDGDVEIFYNEKICKWTKYTYRRRVYLRSIGYNIVPENKSYVLYRDSQNKLILKLN